MIGKNKKRIIITINDYAYNQLLAVVNETKQTKSKIVTEILNRTLSCRKIHKTYIEIKEIERIQILKEQIENDKSKK